MDGEHAIFTGPYVTSLASHVQLCVSSSLHPLQALLYVYMSHCSANSELLRIILLTEMEYLPAVEVLSKRESLCNL